MLTDTRSKRMAKRKRKNRSIPTQTPRTETVRHVLRNVELIRDDFRHEPVVPKAPNPKPDFRPVEDLRHDTQRKTFRTTSGRIARTYTRPQGDVQKSRLHTPLHDYFQDPQRVLVCIRRETRKRVLFALQRIGRGRKVSRWHRFTDKSYVRCK